MKHNKTNMAIVFIMAAIFLSGCTTRVTDDGNREKEGVEIVNYHTVTEGFDWGPAITKLVLDKREDFDSGKISADMFEIQSNRRFREFNWATFSQKAKVSDHVSSRKVIAVYPCDSKGNKTSVGEYTALEMAVGPNLMEGSPFNFNMKTFKNEYIETVYTVSFRDHPQYIFENAGNINLIADDFINDQQFSHNRITLTYASYEPEDRSPAKGSNPLIIWLHGAGEGGTDTRIALLGNRVVNLATGTVQQFFGETGAYILAPQTPTMWMDYNGKGVYNDSKPKSQGKSYYTETLMELITSYVDSHPEIDKNRIYIGGCSNGGYMTVNMILTYPGYFAAAFPVCEAYRAAWTSDKDIENIKELPIWLTHAKTDTTVMIGQGTPGEKFGDYNFSRDKEGNIMMNDEFSNNLYRRLMEAGAENVHYSLFDNVIDTSGLYFKEDGTPYEYLGHWAWIYTLNNECRETINGEELSLFEWLSRQSK